MGKMILGGGGSKIPLSPATIANGFVFTSGRVPLAVDGKIPDGIDAQTRSVMDQIKALVEEAGATMDDVVKTTVFLVRVEDFAGMNAVYAQYFPNDPPARSTIRCELMLDALVEIEAVAVLPS